MDNNQINFNVAESHDNAPKIDGVILAGDKVKSMGEIYDISDKSKSINGKRVYYTIPNVDGNSYATTHTGVGGSIKILRSAEYKGECSNYRPYRVGLSVRGILINNKVIIHSICHNETTKIPTNPLAPVN